MRKIIKLMISGLIILCSTWVSAEKITLICRYDNGTELQPFVIDFVSKKVVWGNIDAGWKLVGELDRFMTMKSPDVETSVGGMYIVVDRFSGDFVLSYASASKVGNKIEGRTDKGSCNRKQF